MWGCGSTLQVEEVSIEEYDYITRSITFPAPQKPLYFKRWNGTFTFYPTPSDNSYTLFFWKIPTTNMSSSVDPETPAVFDPVLEYMSVSKLAPFVGKFDLVPIYDGLYRREMDHAVESRRRTKRSSHSIYYHDL